MSNPQPLRRAEHVPIGKYFLQAGLIDVGQLDAALNYKHEHAVKLGQALVALGFVTETDLVDALRQQGKVHSVHLTPTIVDSKIAFKLGEKMSRQKRVLAVNQVAGHTTVAMEDPSDVYTIDELTRRLETRVLPVFAEPSRIEEALDYVFKKDALKISIPETGRAVDKIAEIAREEEKANAPNLPGASQELRSGEDVTFIDGNTPEAKVDEDLDKPVINLVRSIFEDAFVQGASDIHLEAARDQILVRFRVDGTLFDRTTVPKSWARPMLARIKVLANLDIAQRRLPQDGRIQFRYKNNRVDLRVATTPNLHGESAVLRVLDGGRELCDIQKLDFDEVQQEILERITSQRDGMVVATGPTGSGKTTTLYALLQILNSRDRKIITLEDPVENEMDGIIQINCHHKIGLTFATGLRSILRQDPDVVLVGEIRDGETAQIAIQAAMTGHTVLSTLHTVGAAESVMRLVDMGTEPYLIADTMRGIVAQRLLRRICPDCKTKLQPDENARRRLGLEEDAVFYKGSGCDGCHETGYRGRIGIYEVMEISGEIRRLIETGAGTDALIKEMRDNGTTSLRDDGLRKARRGLTTLQEVLVATSRS